jgi:hypothetical protein
MGLEQKFEILILKEPPELGRFAGGRRGLAARR